MKIAKAICINWGSLQPREFHFAERTLLTGETGSGKSTLLDAIQTVLTAALPGVFQYNAGQGDASQSSRKKTVRTLPSYALGCNLSEFARTEAVCYIALVFTPSTGEIGSTFTAVVGVEAVKDGAVAKEEGRSLMLIRADAAIDDFLLNGWDDAEELRVIPLRDVETKLTARFGKQAMRLLGTNKSDYLQELYGWLQGKPHVALEEAKRAARALVKAIAYKPVESVDELVRNEILEPVDKTDDVKKVSAMLREIQALKVTAARLEANVKRLEAITEKGESAIKTYEDALVCELARSLRKAAALREKIEERGRELEELQRIVRESHAKSESATQRLEEARSRKTLVEARLGKFPEVASEQGLQASTNRLQSELTAQWEKLLHVLRTAEKAVERLRSAVEADLPKDVDQEIHEARNELRVSLSRLTSHHSFRILEQEFTRQFKDNAKGLELFEPAVNTAESLLTETLGLATSDCGYGRLSLSAAVLLNASIQKLTRDIDEKGKEYALLEQGKAFYLGGVQDALDLLNRQLPESTPTVLCDHVAPVEGSEWVAAIESFFGNDRYSIVVKPNYEADAVRCLRKAGVRGPRVLQIERALKQINGRGAVSGSICEELVITNKWADAYVRAAYGNVVKVHSETELKATARGVMKNGWTARSFGMRAASEEVRLVFGSAGRKRTADKVRLEWDELRRRKAELTHSMQAMQTVAGLCDGARALPLYEPYSTLVHTAGELATNAEALAIIRLPDEAIALRNRLNEIKTEEASLAQEERNALIAATEANSGSKVLRDELEQLERQSKSLEEEVSSKRSSIIEYASRYPAFSEYEAFNTAVALSENASFSAEELADKGSEKNQAAIDWGAMRSMLVEYNLKCEQAERVLFDETVRPDGRDITAVLRALHDSHREAVIQFDRQKSNVLCKAHQDLEEAEKRFNSTFIADVVYNILGSIERGERNLHRLDAELQRLQFSNNHYRLQSEWVKEMYSLYKFFDAVKKHAQTLELTDLASIDLGEENNRVYGNLKRLLLSEDAGEAQAELKRICDYRNYKTYEIMVGSRDIAKEMPLSQWGTGSGGETETPFYVVRAAVVTNALKHFSNSPTKLKLMINDEAYTRMDERRSQDVTDFVTDKLGMQLMLAMPTAASGKVKPFFDLEYTFSRVEATGVSGVRFVSEVQEKVLKRKNLAALWEKDMQRVRQQEYEHHLEQERASRTTAKEPHFYDV